MVMSCVVKNHETISDFRENAKTTKSMGSFLSI